MATSVRVPAREQGRIGEGIILQRKAYCTGPGRRGERTAASVKSGDVVYTRQGSFAPCENRERKCDAWKNAKSRLTADSDVERPGGQPGPEGVSGHGRPGARAAKFCAECGEGNQCRGSGLSQEARRLCELGHAAGDRRFLFEWDEVGPSRFSHGGARAVREWSGDRAGLAVAAAPVKRRQSLRPASRGCHRPEMRIRRDDG